MIPNKRINLKNDGSIEIPIEYLQALDFKEGNKLSICTENNELVISVFNNKPNLLIKL